MSLFIYIFVGAIIGYVTNYIAIWMLFHPYEEKRILGMRLPFTPGLIPARQKEIAEKVAKNIRVVFLSGDNLKSLLKRLELEQAVIESIENLLPELPSFLVEGLKQTIFSKVSLFIQVLNEKLIEGLSTTRMEENIEAFLKEKIEKEFSPQELERIILQVAKRELKHITYLGAILGGIIGLANAVVNLIGF